MRDTRTSETSGRRGHGLTLTLAVAGCAVALGACGSSSKPSASASGFSVGIKFADCMRSHGVPNFPDPSAGGGIQITAGSGINPRSPAFQSAQAACAKLLPGAGPLHGTPSKAAELTMLNLSKCMRAHGLVTFPDPTTTPPVPGGRGSLVLGRGGVFLALPAGTNPQSPAFEQAATACGFPVPHGKPTALP